MAKLRQDPNARGLLYEGLWQWLLADKPEAGRDEFSGPFWFQMDSARHWHGCQYCDEPDDARFLRLAKIAISKRLVGLTDDPWTMHDAHNLARVVEVLDEIEQPAGWKQFLAHDCPVQKELIASARGEAKL